MLFTGSKVEIHPSKHIMIKNLKPFEKHNWNSINSFVFKVKYYSQKFPTQTSNYPFLLPEDKPVAKMRHFHYKKHLY